MLYRFLPLLSVLLLTSCASVIDKQNQDVRIETPGAQHASCDLIVEKLRYRYNPPETVNIINSKEDLIVKCLAPGNRSKEITVSSKIVNATYANVTNGIAPGLLWDAVSGAMYAYPDVIEVDFRTVPAKPMPLPAYHDPNIKQPGEYDLEEFLPTSPMLNSDKYKTVTPLKRREIPESSYSQRYGQQGRTQAAIAPATVAITSADFVKRRESGGVVNINDVITALQNKNPIVLPYETAVPSIRSVVESASSDPAVFIPLPVPDGTEIGNAGDAPLLLSITPVPALMERIPSGLGVATGVVDSGPAVDEPAALVMPSQ